MRPSCKKSRRVSLVLAGSLALAGCGDSATQRDIYASREDCTVDWGPTPQKCEPIRDPRTGFWHYYGPSYVYGNRTSVVSGSSHAIGSSVSRGGFGSTGSAHSGGS